MTTDTNEQVILDSWQRNAAPWTALIQNRSLASRRITDPAIVEALLALQPKRVLDIGCGEGWLSRAVSQQGIQTTGVDGIDTLVDAARRQHHDGEYLHLPYEQLPGPLAGRGFDVAVCNFSLFGDQSVQQLIRQLPPLLSSQGHLLIQTLHPAMTHQGDYRAGWRRSDWQGLEGDFGPAPPWYFRPLSAWLDLLQQHGFTVAALREPLCPESHQPLSLILIGQRR